MASLSPFAGKTLDPSQLTDIPALIAAYYDRKPDVSIPTQRVSFGTSGHRGSSFHTSFNEGHILAICEAICRHRKAEGIDGPLFVGMDTHALSGPAQRSAIEVFAAHGLDVRVDQNDGFTPTPVISHAILTYNKGRTTGLADGVV
ncbi:MAG: phosphoglucomutase, alpha-D-glucose phosphate-specific, partial [Acetobacter malorum]